MGSDVILNKIETIERCINENHLKDFNDYIYCINKLL